MRILAFEFSSPQRSVAVLQPAQPAEPSVLAEVVESGKPATKPFAMVDEALRQAGLEREQIQCVAVGLGPGSYTGIRMAIALAQGWQLGRTIKVVGVSSAECLAAQAQAEGLTGRVLVVIDAQRQEFYLAVYDLNQTGYREVESLRLASAEQVRQASQAGGLVVGPEVTTWFGDSHLVFPRAAMLARLAAGHADFIPGECLEPIYLRQISFVKAPPPRQVP